ncbi:MAG: aminomethyl-transferring glycine dehydrogenase [Ignavibacteria bacterium]|nr:aminomethyl-transferring glycine dehydrogenase [Ignavibacteria bacterium]MBT8383049.1 aminomethyl-transferring glycine dehydrogenase [Ignavibacteria bacterium]MBT8391374.1 aminomethyl-transferring glycine dehydrogenase [Ignavibacteria bacterium]NNL22164.1 aminomethyl-transferring glycine dehydrogenase [Ignavibacteriaceae bacterium]
MKEFDHPDKFVNRHIGPRSEELDEMVKVCGSDSIEQLIDETIPEQIRLKKDLKIQQPVNEQTYIEDLRNIAAKNKVFKSYIGMGYHPVILPSVILRNILENPGWYTQYTPYQAEIAQGRLEALLNFQTLISDLTAMDLANASLLDEGSAAAEAMAMFYALRPKDKKDAKVFFVSSECFPQTLDVLKTRANPIGIELRIGDPCKIELNEDIFGILVQFPAGNGEIRDYTDLFEQASGKNIFKVVAADLLSLTLFKPPGEFGADAVVGSSQRFGIPMGFGGPHAAYFATKQEYKRSIPGRIIGVSVDMQGNRAYRMALQTREQHIKRERATSNICTAQVLLAVMAGMYAVYHGSEGLEAIANRIRKFTRMLESAIIEFGFKQLNKHFFDTLLIKTEKSKVQSLKEECLKREINLRYIDDDKIGISINEATEERDIKELIEIFATVAKKDFNEDMFIAFSKSSDDNSIGSLARTSNFLNQSVFKNYRTETELLRYMKRLENKDLSLAHSMIPLGSCTMKLNATTEMAGITWDEFANIHPFAPENQIPGYKQIFDELEKDLCEITGFDAVSLQPNSGAQGEFSGLMVIRAYQKDRGEENRNVVLIPSSAHGTNPASAVMAGMKVLVVNCDKYGNIDIDDLKLKAEQNKENLSALMITYPSTHGVFEPDVIKICNFIHENGGQVYMDGANLNAQVGVTNPAIIGADVCHLNLHKTFCIPHGGGGPGAGPIAVKKHLAPFLPGHSIIKTGGKKAITAVSSAPWGSSDILLISYAYIKMMGSKGLTDATKAAIVTANYMMSMLESVYKVLYTGINGRAGHEFIFDMREFKHSVNIDVEDIAKRLMDYGFHAPTVSFPVPGTLMIEPTESESKAEIDRYCDALLSIRTEIKEIEDGIYSSEDNVLKNAPHTIQTVISDEWKYPYPREKAAYPVPFTKEFKFWPSVGRVDNAYGDRNLVCSCASIEDYIEEAVS